MVNRIIRSIQQVNVSIETPFYLFDEVLFKNNYNSLSTILDKMSCRFSIAYSIKTNPLKEIVSKAKDLGAWAEVTSYSELLSAERCGFEEIYFNGIYKTDEEMIHAARIGATIILDGHDQISRISNIAAKINKNLKVGIRISSFPILNDNGTRFGIAATEPELKQVVNNLLSISNIDLYCLHIHLGTNISNPGLYQQALDRLYKIGIIMKDLGVDVRLYDLGGGMPSCIDHNWKQVFNDGINSFHDLTSDANKTILIEPGRALIESAGFLITRVVDIRKRIDGNGEDALIDVGTNSIMGENMGITHSCYNLKAHYKENANKYRLVGPLCSAEDIILNSYVGGPLNIGDMLLIDGVGAYDFSTAYEFSRGLPRVYSLDAQGQLTCIR